MFGTLCNSSLLTDRLTESQRSQILRFLASDNLPMYALPSFEAAEKQNLRHALREPYKGLRSWQQWHGKACP